MRQSCKMGGLVGGVQLEAERGDGIQFERTG